MTLSCPTCQKKGEWLNSTFGPFCSDRCKLIDLGKWFNEENKISEPLTADHLEEYESLENSPSLDEPENL
jgi:uncharacterized protein